MTVTLLVLGATDVGLVRERNEDAFIVADLSEGPPEPPEDDAPLEGPPEPPEDDAPVQAPRVDVRSAGTAPWHVDGATQVSKDQVLLRDDGFLFAVLDGMGGAASGDVASQIGRDILLEVLLDGPSGTVQDMAEALGSAAVRAHNTIRRHAAENPQCWGMGTTLTAAGVIDDRLVLTQVGDSRAYVFRQDALVQVTEDQSLAHELVATGRMSPEEATHYEHSNVILQALGVNRTVYPSICELPLCREDLLLLCSDGLTDMVPDDAIAEILRADDDLEEMAKKLIAAAKKGGGHDNISVLLGRFKGNSLPLPNSTKRAPTPTPLVVASAPTIHREYRPGFGTFLLVALALAILAGLVIWVGF